MKSTLILFFIITICSKRKKYIWKIELIAHFKILYSANEESRLIIITANNVMAVV